MGFFYEALRGSESVCKGSNPFTAATKKVDISALFSLFSPIFACIYNIDILRVL